ncbi:MAG: biotin--[acetyl-CoA-carboxylase] ligase [Planctomycetota bacterium]
MSTAAPPAAAGLAERLAALVAAGDGIGTRILWFDAVRSTNDTVLERVAAGDPPGTVVFAEHQSRGRGRGHNRWHAPAGEGLLFSTALRRTAADHLFTGMGALAVAGACRAPAGVAAQIKWPNDVVVGGRKVSGILAEQRVIDGADWVVLGIGVNINSTSATLPDPVAGTGTSLRIAAGRAEPFDRVELAAAILAGLRDAHAQVAAGNAAGLCARWYALLAVRGRDVVLTRRPGRVRGRLEGLNPDGSFRVRTDTGVIDETYGNFIIIGREDDHDG